MATATATATLERARVPVGVHVALAVAWPVALIAAVYAVVGRLGFYPSDEGLVQAYAWRILHGEVPHRDFISPLPLGSALIHIVDFAVPGPLFEVSRVIALSEYVAYSMVFAWLIFEIAPWSWSLLATIGAAGSVLVNLNVFPLMPWYTVDGLLMIATGYLVITRGVRVRDRRWVAAGFVIVGLAAVTKQSYVPATAFGWFLLWPWWRELSWIPRFQAALVTGVLAALPLLTFLGVISALGGVSALRTQLLGDQLVYGRPLAAEWSPANDLWVVAPLVLATAALTAGVSLAKNRTGWSLLGRVGVSGLILAVPLWARLGVNSLNWSLELTWVVIAFVGVRFVLLRSFDSAGPLLIGVAWMSMLSYGWAWTTFMAGTSVLYVLQRVWRDAGLPDRIKLPVHGAGLVAAALALVLTTGLFVTTREQRVYLDRPADQLTASLSDVSPAFGDIRTNPETHAYLLQMVRCIREHPARRIAVLPENPAIYPALGLDNPFPIDWMWPNAMRGSDGRILATADQLNREGDYLVLFQTFGQREVVGGGSLPPATIGEPVYGDTALIAEVYARLQGARSVCGSFLVVYAPA